ncbi:MAG: Pyruvate dehydrogenase E1 component, partial [uncultured Frankineae bacterium]
DPDSRFPPHPRRRARSPAPRRPAQPAARPRPRRDRGVARVARRGRRRRRAAARPLPHAQAPRARAGEAGRRAGPAQHRLHQHHPAGARARLPRRRAHRAAHPGVRPVERRHHGQPREPPRDRGRRAHRDVRQRREPVRGRLQPLLPRPRAPGRRRPRLLPGPREPGRVRPRLPRGPRHRGAARRLPAGEPPRRRAVELPAPAAHAGVLGVPDGVDGPRPDLGDLPGAVRQVPPAPRHQGHLAAAGLVLPRRRRDGRAGEPRRDRRRRPRGARQPDVRHQLQPAAPRRPGARQRQGHPGARVELPRRRLERRQGRLGPPVGRPARPGRRRAAARADERHAGRPVPDLLGRERRLHPREVLRLRPAAAEDGRAPVGRADPRPAARRPRLPQGLRRLRRGDPDGGPADGDPRPHDQGLDAGQGLRGPQRDPPDEEAHQARAQGAARPALPADRRQGPRGRAPALLPPRRGQRRSPLHEGAPGGPRRLDPPPRGARQAPGAAPERGLRRAQAGLGQAVGRHDDGLRPPAQGPHEGQGHRRPHRAGHPRRGPHLRHRRDVPVRQDLLAVRAEVRGGRPRAAAVLQGVGAGPDPARGHLRGRLDGLGDRGRHVLRHARRADDPGLRLLLHVRLPAHRRPDVGVRRPARARLPARRHGRAHHAERRGAAAPGRAQPAARLDQPRGGRVRPGLLLRGQLHRRGRAAADVRGGVGGRLLLPERLQRALPAAGDARARGAAGGRPARDLPLQLRRGRGSSRAGAGERHRRAPGHGRAAAAARPLGRGRRRLERHELERAASGRGRVRGAQPAAPGRGAAPPVRADHARGRAGPVRRRQRLDAGGARHAEPLDARRLHLAGHRRLRTLRHPREPAAALPHRPGVHRGRGADRACPPRRGRRRPAAQGARAVRAAVGAHAGREGHHRGRQRV